MRLLVTGSNGFVGSHIAEYFASRGHQVSCLVRHTSNCRWLSGLPVTCVTGEITRPETLAQAVKNVDVIIHAAGVVRALDRQTYFTVNEQGTRNLAEAALAHNPSLKRFVLISSQAAMGPSTQLRPKQLHEPHTPVSDYGKSKLAGELALKETLNDKMPYTILRPSAVYGPRDRDILIFFQLVHHGIVPRTAHERFLQLLYVLDIPVAVEKAITMEIARGKTYCLGEQGCYTWEQVGRTIAAAAGRKAFTIPVPDAAFQAVSFFAELGAQLCRKPAVLNRQKIDEMRQSYWLADSTATAQELAMHFTNFSRGAKMSYDWYRKHKWL